MSSRASLIAWSCRVVASAPDSAVARRRTGPGVDQGVRAVLGPGRCRRARRRRRAAAGTGRTAGPAAGGTAARPRPAAGPRPPGRTGSPGRPRRWGRRRAGRRTGRSGPATRRTSRSAAGRGGCGGRTRPGSRSRAAGGTWCGNSARGRAVRPLIDTGEGGGRDGAGRRRDTCGPTGSCPATWPRRSGYAQRLPAADAAPRTAVGPPDLHLLPGRSRWSAAGPRSTPGAATPSATSSWSGGLHTGPAYVLPDERQRGVQIVGAPAGRAGPVRRAGPGAVRAGRRRPRRARCRRPSGSAAGCAEAAVLAGPVRDPAGATCAAGSTPTRSGGNGSGPSWSRPGAGWPGTAAPGRWTAWRPTSTSARGSCAPCSPARWASVPSR